MQRFRLFILATIVALIPASALPVSPGTSTRLAGTTAAGTRSAVSTTRVVTGTIRKATGAAWVGASITFKLDRSSYTATDQFPADTVTATTDSNGQFSQALWCNAEGQILTRYTVTLPDNSSFSFRLAAGASSVDLAVLRASGTSIAPANTDTYAVLGTMVDAHAAVKAGASTLGHIKVGSGLTVSADGTLSTVIAAADLPTGINATKIADGSVSNTEFQYLDGATSALQTQLNSKATAADLVTEQTTRAAADTTLQTNITAEATTRAAADTALQSAVDGKQPLDSDLTSVAGLSPANDDLLQRKSGAWTNRTPAQVKSDLALTKSDVGLGNVDNTSDADKPISTATQTALDAKQPLDSDLTAAAALAPTNDDILQRKSGAWTNRTPAQLKTDLALTKSDVGLANVDNTSDAAKPVSTATQTALNAKAPLAHTHAAADLPATTVNSVVNDTNVTGSISAQALTLGWTGTLAKARQNSATVYGDQANTFSGNQRFDGLIQFAGTTNSFPALKRSSGNIQFRLADDSAYANGEMLSLSVYNTGGTTRGALIRDSIGLELITTNGVRWSNSATEAASTKDTGLERVSAGKIKWTDGGVGVGGTLTSVASSANYVDISSAAASAEPVISAVGSDTDVDIKLTPKGAGYVHVTATGIKFPDGSTQTVAASASTGEQLLSSTSVNLDNAAAQDLYTVPSGKKLIVTRVVLRDGSAPFGDGGTGTFTIIRSNDAQGLTAATSVTAALTTERLIIVLPTGTLRPTTATNKAQFIVDVAYGSACTATIDLFGYLVDA